MVTRRSDPRIPRLLGWIGAVVFLLGSPMDVAGQETVYAEIQPDVGVSVELGGTGGFAETVFFSLYFLSDSSSLVASVVMPGNEIVDASVLNIADGDRALPALVEQCQLVDAMRVCDPLDEPATFEIVDDGEGHGPFLEIEIPEQRIDWENGFLRLSIAAGRYTLSVLADDALRDPRPSPGIDDATLPHLSDLEQQYLEQRPFLNVDASPLVRGQQTGEGGFDNLGVSFAGGVFRVLGGGGRRLQLTWDGEVATSDSATFNHLTFDAGVAQNLWPGDWVPLTLSLQGETDQGFNAADVSANARLSFILPFNVNLQSGSYRPALSPRIELLAAYGSAIERDVQALEEDFFRAGYEIQWRIPLGEANLVRFRHANVWNDPGGAKGAWHTLWDIQLEVAMGGMTYFVGYQEGEAAPLFEPIQTTRVGAFVRDRESEWVGRVR